ncbi:hypothetical protein [Pantoea sp. Taur]|uniref:hypothetical protein n=1 Tax=Pantoea sp. Taur TaxID=2576757 RepID=UPI001353E61F|nr:hypothetical protein [Pantoea sp. Taur]MXP57132.1 hypothetical protein [Pantoea sp. Taur]
MKSLLSLLALSVMLIKPLHAAAPEVPQQIMPIDPRCSVSVGNSNIDYGRQSRGQLQYNGSTYTPGKRVMSLSVVCPFAQPIKMVIQGDRAADGSLRYGDKGRLKVKISDARLDGQPVQLSDISDGKKAPQSELVLKADSRFAASANGLPLSGKSFSARLELEPELSMDAATVSNSTLFESRFSLDMIN